MVQPNRDAPLVAFKQTFRQLAPYKHCYEVFKDVVTMAVCSLHTGIHKDKAQNKNIYARYLGEFYLV